MSVSSSARGGDGGGGPTGAVIEIAPVDSIDGLSTNSLAACHTGRVAWCESGRVYWQRRHLQC